MTSFYDQLSCMCAIFDTWTPCERTVVLCALMRRVPWYNLRLLNRTIEAGLQHQTCPDTEKLETEANDIPLITEMVKTTDENDAPVDMTEKLNKLMVYMPLMDPGNEPVKQIYLTSLPTIIQLCVDTDHCLPECQQLLSYMLIHPGLKAKDRQSLGQWLRRLENHLSALLSGQVWQQRMYNQCSGNRSPLPSNGFGAPPNGDGVNANENVSPHGYGYDIKNYSNCNVAPNDNEILSTGNGTPNEQCTLPYDNTFSINGANSLSNFINGPFRRTIGKNMDPKIESVGDCLTPDGLQESFSKNGRELDLSNEGDGYDAPIQKPRSNSLTPPTLSCTQFSSSAENLNNDEYFVQKPRSFSLCSEHMSQMKPLLTTTGSETRLDVLRSQSFGEHPGMSTVAQWLKSLRLHKYVWLFTNISYEQMMAMDDEYLEKLAGATTSGYINPKGVTKGARHKLLVCINKLHERDTLLELMYRELTGGSPSQQIMALMLEQLREVLVSPIPPASHLPLRLVKVLELASKRLLSGGPQHPPLPAFPAYNHHDERSYEHPVTGYDPLSLHCWLVDRALHHPSFNWNRDLVDMLKRMRYRLPPKQYFNHLSDLPFTKRTAKPRWRTVATKPQPAKRPPATWLQVPAPPVPAPAPPPPPHDACKSSSYPQLPPAPSPRLTQHAASLGDINCRLESLCRQMTEQAMN